jgi:lauroyl/myristoyl acyltransferase
MVRLCPAGRRFHVAERLSAFLLRIKRTKITHSLREATLLRILDLLTRNGTTFPVPIRVRGAGVLPSALEAGTGVLLVTTHSVLNTLLLRYLHDLGHVPHILAVEPDVRVIGTRSVLRGMGPSATTLLRIRRGLAEGRIAAAMIDSDAPAERRARQFTTAAGEMRISDALFHLAARCGAQIVFIYFHLGADRRIEAIVEGPWDSTGSVSAVTDRFTRFVQDQTERAATLP